MGVRSADVFIQSKP